MKKLTKFNYILFGCVLGIINIISSFIFSLLIYYEKINKYPSIIRAIYTIITILAFILVFVGIFKKEKKKDIYTKKSIVIWLSIILFCSELITIGIIELIDGFFFMLSVIFATLFQPISILSYIILIYGISLNTNSNKNEKNSIVKENTESNFEIQQTKTFKGNKKCLWTIVLAISLFAFITMLMSIFYNAFFIIIVGPICMVLIILIIISIIKINQQKKSKKYKNIYFRVSFTLLTIIINSLLIPYTMINNFIIIILSLITLTTLWYDLKSKKSLFIVAVISELILISLTINYLIIEPRINSINYLNHKYGLEKDKLKIKDVNFMCDTSQMFSSSEPCIDVNISYDKYDINVYKFNKNWHDNVSYGNEYVDFKTTDKYKDENNISKPIYEQIQESLVDVLEKYSVDYKNRDSDEHDTFGANFIYYIVNTSNVENVKNISMDVKNKLKEFYNNATGVDGRYLINIVFVKTHENYKNWAELEKGTYGYNYETNVSYSKYPEYTNQLNYEKDTNINSEDFNTFNNEFFEMFKNTNHPSIYDYAKYEIQISGNIKNGVDDIIIDEYKINYAKIVEKEEIVEPHSY